MPFENLFPRKKVFAISCAMRCDLRSSRTLSAHLLKMLFDLRTSRTRCFQILLRVALDLWLPMLAPLDLVAQQLQSHGKL